MKRNIEIGKHAGFCGGVNLCIKALDEELEKSSEKIYCLAKWLIAQSQILILDEPTRGIDVNAKSEFYTLMNDFVDQGGTIVMVSSELPEVLGVSDRIIVMCEGKVTGELSREEANEQKIMYLASQVD